MTMDSPVRPNYLDEQGRTDDVARIVLALAGEVWSLRDRLLVLEEALSEAGVVAPERLDATPSPELADVLRRNREDFVARVLGAVLPQSERVNEALSRAVNTTAPTATGVATERTSEKHQGDNE